jgi:hypothetical protein
MNHHKHEEAGDQTCPLLQHAHELLQSTYCGYSHYNTVSTNPPILLQQHTITTVSVHKADTECHPDRKVSSFPRVDC